MWYLSPDLLANLKISKGEDGQFYYNCYVSGKAYKARPEELIRQLLLIKLNLHYNIPRESMFVEFPIQIGRTKKRADVLVMGTGNKPHIIAETKTLSDADTIHQLQSYVNVTHAQYGIIATQAEFLTFQSLNGALESIPDLPIAGSASGDRHLIERPSVDMLGFEKLLRVNEMNSVLVIKGISFHIENSDLYSFQKIRKVAISKGVILPVQINDVYWTQILQELFESAEKAPTPERVPSPLDQGLKTFLISCEANKTGPFTSQFLSARQIKSYILKFAPKNIQKSATNRAVASVLKEIGFESYVCRVTEKGISSTKRFWFKGTKEEFEAARMQSRNNLSEENHQP